MCSFLAMSQVTGLLNDCVVSSTYILLGQGDQGGSLFRLLGSRSFVYLLRNQVLLTRFHGPS